MEGGGEGTGGGQGEGHRKGLEVEGGAGGRKERVRRDGPEGEGKETEVGRPGRGTEGVEGGTGGGQGVRGWRDGGRRTGSPRGRPGMWPEASFSDRKESGSQVRLPLWRRDNCGGPDGLAQSAETWIRATVDVPATSDLPLALVSTDTTQLTCGEP